MRTTKKKKTELDAIAPLAHTVYELNRRMNEAKRLYDAERKKLFSFMKENGITEHKSVFQMDNITMTLLSVIESKSRSEIDVKKLARAVPMETLLDCVTASVTTVERVAGSAVASMCSVEGKTAENVTVKSL
jgi:hypothetical protein